MKFSVEERACELAEYIIEHRATVRAAAKRFGISKSTVHKDVTERLREIDRSLYLKVREILIENKSERHIRGGMATKQKYENLSRLQAEKSGN
ncbi:MAG: sporulation transcriptional regulator SpoIIID [Clostridiaceae bacterium]|nr:sporulation transcriptional regulator SpoIIID [Clostridiaceae bacterium]MDD6273191.1 sporulation transcriptional regulator SpoIIID [Clostridiaceae bacterium]